MCTNRLLELDDHNLKKKIKVMPQPYSYQSKYLKCFFQIKSNQIKCLISKKHVLKSLMTSCQKNGMYYLKKKLMTEVYMYAHLLHIASIQNNQNHVC